VLLRPGTSAAAKSFCGDADTALELSANSAMRVVSSRLKVTSETGFAPSTCMCESVFQSQTQVRRNMLENFPRYGHTRHSLKLLVVRQKPLNRCKMHPMGMHDKHSR
jgi:hypothetical protein